MAPPLLYDAEETGAILHVSKEWLRRRAGQTIPCTRLGRQLMWTEEQITRIIMDAAVEPSVPRVAQQAPTVPIKAATTTSRPPRPVPDRRAASPDTRRAVTLANTRPIPVADFSVSRLYRDRPEVNDERTG